MRFSHDAAGGDALIESCVDKETENLLAWYVNGTLAGPDRDRVEAALRDDAGAASRVAWERAVQVAVKSDPALEIAPDRGLYQVLQRIRADTSAKAAPRPAQGGWLSSLREKFQWSPALALACGVVAVQFAVIGQMWMVRGEEGEYAGVRAVSSGSHAAIVFIRIAFKPQSLEGDVSSLLRAIHAEIVSGPSQLGDYYLLLEKRSAPDALSLLQSNTNVDSAEIVNALPARP